MKDIIHTRILRRLAMAALAAVPLLSVVACSDEELVRDGGGEDGFLSAVKVPEAVSRSVPPNEHFKEGSTYRIYAYERGTVSPLFPEEGIVGRETASHYVSLTDNGSGFNEENALLRGDVDIYGFTEMKTSDGNMSVAPAATGKNGDGTPLFSVKVSDEYQPSDCKPGKNEDGSLKMLTNYIFPDYMRAKVEHEGASSATAAVLEFRHVMSQLDIQVVQQEEDGGTAKYDLNVKSVSVAGVNQEQTYDVVAGNFIEPVNPAKQEYKLWESPDDAGTLIDTVSMDLVRTVVFPTTESDKQKNQGISLKVELAGADAAHFAKEIDGKYIVNVPVYSNIDQMPLELDPNFRYTLQVAFINGDVRIVTLIPQVHPWFDGEGKDGDGYKEQDLGDLALFDNLVWSPFNVGAEISEPIDRATFWKSMGFFYQGDRNIPFFLNDKGYTGNLDQIGNKNVYPVVLGKDFTTNKQWRILDAAPGKKSSTDDVIDWLGDFNEMYDEINKNKNKISYATNWLYHNTSTGWYKGQSMLGYINRTDSEPQMLWNNVSTQPTPPGWRMPTEEDFMKIMPSTPHAGNITFLSNFKYGGPGNIGETNSPIMNDTKVIYVKVDGNGNSDSKGTGEYFGGTGGNSTPENYKGPKPKGDPASGYSSEYVISKQYGSRDFVGKPVVPIYNSGGDSPKDAEWGCIYGIKKVGTPEAYRMRWHIVGLSNDANCYMLVVSRYSASETDRLLYDDNDKGDPHYYMNYDWSHPVAQIYFPIVGLIGDVDWNGGIWSLYGVETIYATSTVGAESNIGFSKYSSYVTLRIKIGGDQRKNQSICISQDRCGTGSQIRCVRDYDEVSTRINSRRR